MWGTDFRAQDESSKMSVVAFKAEIVVPLQINCEKLICKEE